MKILIVLMILVLTGCATPPRFLANMYDSNDPCQNYYNKANYQYPNWCGANNGKTYMTRDYYTNRTLTTTR